MNYVLGRIVDVYTRQGTLRGLAGATPICRALQQAFPGSEWLITCDLDQGLVSTPEDFMTETDVAWIAALLEGEGYFYIENDRRPCVRLGMSDVDVVERYAK